MHPYPTTMQEMLDRPSKGLHELASAVQREAYQVHDGIGLQRPDPVTEDTGCFSDVPIDPMIFHLLPGGTRRIWRAFSPADDDDMVPGSDEARNQVGPDVTTSAQNNDSHCLNFRLG